MFFFEVGAFGWVKSEESERGEFVGEFGGYEDEFCDEVTGLAVGACYGEVASRFGRGHF